MHLHRAFHPTRRQLAAAIAGLYALSSPLAHATKTVTNCADSGAGSLRATIASAVTGEVVDASTLGCSSISLTTGAIVFNQTDLIIRGPASGALTLTGKYQGHVESGRLLTDYGFGTLSIQNMKLKYGNLATTNFAAEGGCVRTSGNLILSGVTMSDCVATTTTGQALGGGAYAGGGVTLINSTVKYNKANGGSGTATGGGIYANGNLAAKYSTVLGNKAYGSGTSGFAGGLYVRGASTFIISSTIAKNTAGLSNGGIAVHNLSGKVTIQNSTISGNVATAGSVGGLYSSAADLYLYNSTIALNTAATSSAGSGGVGLAVYGGSSTPKALMYSTLIANNTFGATSTNKDLSSSGVTITGSNNLVRVPDGAVPTGTIVGKCPLLAPLAANGGPTMTHALRGHSPAIDTGSNPLGLDVDQRSTGFKRESGPPGVMTPVADIGAFEVDQSEIVFEADFEGCT